MTRQQRSGVAMIVLVVLLASVAVIMAALTWQSVAQHKFLRQREHQLQAYWLAQAGIELAAAHLLADDQKPPSKVDVMPGAEVLIKIEAMKDQERMFQVTSEARYPLDEPVVVSRTATRVFRLVRDGDKSRLEVLHTGLKTLQ